MDFPRLIHLDDETNQRLVSYLETELLNHYAERGSWVSDLEVTQTDYFAEPSQVQKTFPFKGAANIVIPLIATVVEALHAKSMTTLFALDDFVNIKVPGIYEDINWGLSKYSNWELLENGADMYRFADNALLENFKFGTCVGKAGYEKVEKTAVRESGGQETEFTIVTKQGAVADAVQLANFLMPFYCQDPQVSPWCGEEHDDPSYKVKQLCDSGFFYDDAWEKLENWVLQTNNQELSSTPYRQNLERIENKQPVYPKMLGWIELWMSWNVDGGDADKEVVVYYHRLSRTILGIRYNWYDDLRRPYRYCNYFKVEHRWAGIGVGKQIQSFQREITIQHRQRLDNATVANIRMFKINKLSGYGPGEPIFPGKLWFVDSMDDIESIQAGEVYPSSFNDEIQSLSYAQQRSGVNELNLGMPEAGTPGTATSNTQRLQEGNRKSDYSQKNIRRFLTEISRDVICNVFQFGTRNVKIFDYIPNGPKVQQFIKSAPMDLVREQLIMNMNLVGMNENQLQDRASWTQIGGQLQQYYTSMMEFAMQTQDKNLLAMLAKIIPSGATEAMQQILETYDIRNIDRIIPQQLILGYQPDLINNPAINQQLGQPNGPEGTPDSGGNPESSRPLIPSGMGGSNPGY